MIIDDAEAGWRDLTCWDVFGLSYVPVNRAILDERLFATLARATKGDAEAHYKYIRECYTECLEHLRGTF